MKYKLEDILDRIERDLSWHELCKDRALEGSPDWNFHLGWLDALTSYRDKLQNLEKGV